MLSIEACYVHIWIKCCLTPSSNDSLQSTLLARRNIGIGIGIAVDLAEQGLSSVFLAGSNQITCN